jgi:hypothetical protein
VVGIIFLYGKRGRSQRITRQKHSFDRGVLKHLLHNDLRRVYITIDNPYGLVGFTVNCTAADVSLTFTGATDLSGQPYRRHGPTTPGVPSTTRWYTYHDVTIAGNMGGSKMKRMEMQEKAMDLFVKGFH